MVLEALVPCHLQKLKSNTVTMESASAARDEIAAIAALATSLQALLYSSEALTRFVSPSDCFCVLPSFLSSSRSIKWSSKGPWLRPRCLDVIKATRAAQRPTTPCQEESIPGTTSTWWRKDKACQGRNWMNVSPERNFVDHESRCWTSALSFTNTVDLGSKFCRTLLANPGSQLWNCLI